MTALLGYCDPISVAPGARVRFLVSCIGAARYQAEIVRLINPQAGPLATPFRTEPVDCAANRSYPGRRQAIHIGSFGVVDARPAFGDLTSFTLQAYVWPTTPGRSRQALLGTWSESGRRGIGLGLDERGALELRIGDGAAVATLSSGQPLLARRWYLVAGSFDGASGRMMLWQEPVHDPSFHDQAAVQVGDHDRGPPRGRGHALPVRRLARGRGRGPDRLRPAGGRRPLQRQARPAAARQSRARARRGRGARRRRRAAVRAGAGRGRALGFRARDPERDAWSTARPTACMGARSTCRRAR